MRSRSKSSTGWAGRIADLDKQIEDLTYKSQSADAHYKHKLNIILEAILNSEKTHRYIHGQQKVI